ncbi:MAG TPA: efflux RND transporter periplasmic adaptor subunit [Chthoniobacteraceae bacterium]|jgi:putative peptide zinc metalloprotease protein|nr:efflux RND transporter periplasmic adaptor subunit [Chthoniobacteraceae bacterium]
MMTESPDAPRGFEYETALPRLRSDLRFSRQIYRNRVSFVVKDPVALKYYRIGEMERNLGALLNGRRSMRDILDILKREYPWEPIDLQRIEETFRLFFQLSLLQADPEMATRVYDLSRNQKKKVSKSLESLAMLVFYFKVPLFDPDLLLFKMDRWLGFLWTRVAVCVEMILLAIAGWTVCNNLPKMHESLGSLLTLHNLFLLWAVTMGVKVFHEFGHGLACKHFGGEVHEMGAAFLLLSPFLFCDATDSWMFVQKKYKIIVSMAGIYIELFIASVCALVWANTDRGLVNQLAYNTMIVCSLTTLLFNANPLMRFDGYYALADILDVPNLRERARQYFLSSVARLFTGGPCTPEMIEVHEQGLARRIVFDIFAVASYFYTFFITFRIIHIVGIRLEPIGLAKWGQALEISFCTVSIFLPAYAFTRELRSRAMKNPGILMNVRVFKNLLIGAAILAAIALCPWSVNVTAEGVLYDGGRDIVHADSPGYIREIDVKAGDHVHAGQILAKLENEVLTTRRDDVDARIQTNYIERRVAVASGDGASIRQARTALGDLIIAKNKADKDCDALVLYSSTDGIIGTEDLETRKGEYLQVGELFCEVIPENRLQVRIALDEREAGLVRKGQSLEFRTYAFPDRVFTGVVSKVFSSVSESLPADAMAARAGGDIPTALDAQGHEHPLLPTFIAELEINNPDGLLRPGMSGRGRITCEHSRLGIQIYERIQELLKVLI